MRGRKAKQQPGSVSHAPSCPGWLDLYARAEWNRIVPLLDAGGSIQECDLAIVAAYCTTFSLWSEIQKTLGAHNIVSPAGKLNPAARYCESLLKQLRGLLDQLGFTPAARKQILMGATHEDTMEEVLS